MMRFEPCEEGPKVNTLLQSGPPTGADKGEHPQEGECVYKAPEKETGLDL